MGLEHLEELRTTPMTQQQLRAKAEGVAAQFEAVFVRSLVSSLRQTASVGGEGGMFGSETGADTYADWFDQNVAEELGKNGGIGIAKTVLADMERHGELRPDVERIARLQRAAVMETSRAIGAKARGGFDVLL